MIFHVMKLRSFAMVLSLTTPFVMAEEAKVNGLPTTAAVELLYQIETLQAEVKTLRGLLEEQSHELQKMKRSQKDRYIDLDKRLSILMSQPASPAVAAKVLPPTVTPDASSIVSAPVTNQAATAPVVIKAATAEIQESYRSSYELIRQKKFTEADAAFTAFVNKYPNNELTGNAYYWLGELKLVLGDQQSALTNFKLVAQRFPGHSKESDALYKIGIVYDQLDNKEEAKKYLNQVVIRFPESNTAKLATSYLTNMK